MDEVAKAIGELTAEVRNVGTRLDRLEKTITDEHRQLEHRVRVLELWRSWTAGAGAVLGAAVAWLFAK